MKKYFKKKCEKEPWQIAAARYCVTNSEEGFTKKGLIEHIKSSYKVSEVHLQQFYDEEIYKPTGREHSRNFVLTDEGGNWIPPIDMVSKITDYDALQEARKSSRKALLFAGFSTLVGASALVVGVWTAILTQHALELSADPVLSVLLDRSNIPENADDVSIALGLLPAEDSILKLLLSNNSISAVEQVDIRMTLWKFYVDGNNRHLTVCPFGYVSHDNNPNFVVSDLRTYSLFNKNLSLKKGGIYPLTVDFSNLENIVLNPDSSKILLKVDVNFVKTTSQINHSYIKLYVLNSFGKNVVDVDVAPTFALSLNDKKEEKEIEGLGFPSFVYPFQEEEFLEYFERPSSKLDLTPSTCREFTLSKEQKVITY